MARIIPFLLLFFALPAHAAWLVGLADDATRVDLASRDVPTNQLDYDGRAHGVIGGTFVVWQRDTRWPKWWGVQWQVFALAAADNGTSRGPWPTELARWQAGTRVTVTTPELRSRYRYIVDVAVLRQVAATLGSYALPEGPPTGGIAFGGGGYVLDLGFGSRRDYGPFQMAARIGDRLHLPGLLALFGQRVAADTVGDALGDNVLHQLQGDLAVTVTAWPSWQPLFACHVDVLVPLDASGRGQAVTRFVLGALHPLERGGLLPFASLDVGAGPGLLVNRDELRFGLGVRYVPQ